MSNPWVVMLKELQDVLAPWGLTATAITIAGFLYIGAKLYEKDASESALKSVANLLINGNVTEVGALVARLVLKYSTESFVQA